MLEACKSKGIIGRLAEPGWGLIILETNLSMWSLKVDISQNKSYFRNVLNPVLV